MNGYTISSKRDPRVVRGGVSNVLKTASRPSAEPEETEGKMTWPEAEDYVVEHFGEESGAMMAEATGLRRQSIYQIAYKLKKNGRIPPDRESWGFTKGPNAAIGKREQGVAGVGVVVPPPTPPAPPPACQTGLHIRWISGSDRVIEDRFPDFFKGGAHPPSKFPEEWQVCQDCGHAILIRPKYPWDKGVSVTIPPSLSGMRYPAELVIDEPHTPSPPPGTIEHFADLVIDEPGSEMVGALLLESGLEADAGAEADGLASTVTDSPTEVAQLWKELAGKNSELMLLRVELHATHEKLNELNLELGEARRQLRVWQLEVQLNGLERQAEEVRREIASLKEQAA